MATVNGSMILPMGSFYQFGYVTRDLASAVARLEALFGVSQFRCKRANEWMETAHAWTGASMIEVIAPGDGAPPLYTDYLPEMTGALRLHHLGRRIATRQGWAGLEQAIADHGLVVPFGGSAMDGQICYAYVDTREALGIYTEYVFLEGAALNIYDDVPQNN